MGNRGTTPSWDEEEIAKWGLFGHFANITRGFQARDRRHRQSLEAKLLEVLHALAEQKKARNSGEAQI